MIVTAIQCEICEKTHQVDGQVHSYEWNVSASWITLFLGSPERGNALHFCSQECLAQWTGVAAPMPEPQLQPPACKARRFILVDGDADETEGVLWGNGRVTIEPPYDSGIYISWDVFKSHHVGDGVTWIDPEVSNA